VQLTDFAAMDFDAQANAYGSIFYVLGGFVLAIALTALVVDAVVLYGSRGDHYTPHRHGHVLGAARFWAVLNVVWLLGLGTLYLAPRLT